MNPTSWGENTLPLTVFSFIIAFGAYLFLFLRTYAKRNGSTKYWGVANGGGALGGFIVAAMSTLVFILPLLVVLGFDRLSPPLFGWSVLVGTGITGFAFGWWILWLIVCWMTKPDEPTDGISSGSN